MKKVAVIEGGYSSEKVVSIKSAQTVFDNLDRKKYLPTRVLIDENEWTAYDEDGRYPIDKNDFSFCKNNHAIVIFFIIKEGQVVFQYVNPDYSQRLSPNTLLAILKTM